MNTTNKKKGMVYLVGAGPGDPGLLTLRAAELLGRADVVLYDHLLDPSVLCHVKEGARLFDVGKTAGGKNTPQGRTEKLMIREAMAGRSVVRLKGGDPFIFGRGGEEGLALKKAGIAFEIVPGVTSAIAVPAYAGIPLTHRRISSSCAIITGNEDPTKRRSDIDWDHLSKGTSTLVFLMGTKNQARIARRLIQSGLKKSTPCAVISAGTYVHQKTVLGNLSNIANKFKKAKLPKPTVLVVGEVVGLRKKLQWFENRPLFGKTVLVTRAREQSSDLVKTLEALGAKAYQAPTIRIVPPESYEVLDEAVRGIENYAWVFFTSVNGVKSFLSRLKANKQDLKVLNKIKIGVIGPASGDPLKEAGLKVSLIPKRFVSEGILEALDRRRISLKGKRVLLVRADEVRDLLAKELRGKGAHVEEVIAYKTVSERRLDRSIVAALQAGRVDWITFTSSSTVKNFFGLVNGDVDKKILKDIGKASIGPITSKTLRSYGYRPKVEAREHTIPGLIKALLRKGSK